AMQRSRSEPRSLDGFARGKLANMHADLASVYHGIGFFAEAVREYEKALGLSPSFVDLRTKLANTYRDMGELDTAIEQYQKVFESKPNFLQARLQLGITLYMGKRVKEAITEWRKTLAIDPTSRTAKIYLKMVGETVDPDEGTVDPDKEAKKTTTKSDT
ncbi:MAG: tetratricopeptide repeat protein, partial [Deltaproteobacteria bacterium]|nr:tetratricopeptide repeat protein [Deltaproteobacteria bacterium]